MSEVAARVNSRDITTQELNEMINAYSQQTKTAEVSDDQKKMLLENLIENRLLQEESKDRGLEVTKELLDQQLSYFYQQYGGEEQLKAMLSAQNIKIEDIVENIKLDLQGQLTAQDEIKAKLNLTDNDLTDFYDQHKDNIKTDESFRASHILFKADDKEVAETVLKDITDGGDFETLAKEHSTCPSKEKGGDLNFFGKGQMVPEFENAVTSMKIDEVSGLVETQFGFHIIKKTGEVEGKHLSFDEAKGQIKDILTKERGQVIIKDLVDSLRNKFEIEYLN